MMELRQADGTYLPHPDYHPNDLVVVRDIYGHRHKIRSAHYAGGRLLLPRFNQHGRRILDLKCVGKAYVHRDNILSPPTPQEVQP